MKFRKFFTVLGIAAAFVCLMLFPQQASCAIKDGLALCVGTIVPAMFPYFILSNLFISLGCADTLGNRLRIVMAKVFRVSGKGAAPLLLGLIGGYPMGAKAIAELYGSGQITKPDAEKLLFFTCNAGPAFLIGVVGGALFRSVAAGLTLYTIHVFSALLCGLLIASKAKETKIQKNVVKPSTIISFPNALVRAVTSSIQTTLQVCGYILLFSLFISVEKQLLSHDTPLLLGITELSAGCDALAKANIAWPLKFTLISATVSFGGLCVLCQTMSVLSDTDLSIRPYFLGKITQALISAVISYPISFLLQHKVSAAVFPENVKLWSPLSWKIPPIFLLILFFLQFPSSFSRRRRL